MKTLDYEIPDDSGFMALVDPDAYDGFVSEDWELDQLLTKFRAQMASRRLLIWGTGTPNLWAVHVAAPGRAPAAFRSTSGSIHSTRGRLLLTNYESLSMAAQFSHVTLPQRYESEQVFTVPAGSYQCTVHQLRDPDHDESDDNSGPAFIVELGQNSNLFSPWEAIPWFDRQ